MKFPILPLLLLSSASCVFGQMSAVPAAPAPKPPSKLDLFDGSLYAAEPFLDSALLLSKEQYDAILAAQASFKSDPKVSAAKKAESSAAGEGKGVAKQSRREVENAARAVLAGVLNANLTEEAKTLVESLNRYAKEQKKRATNDAGLSGLTKLDPQYEELKKKAGELERQYLKEMLASTLTQPQKAAIENARGQKPPTP